MSRIKYLDRRFGDAAALTIQRADTICAQYQAQGFDLTLRQLYYQFVARDWIANRQSEYKRLGDIINDARLAGLLDWDYIVDRTRNLRQLANWADPGHIINAVSQQYREDKWAQQDTYVEVWIEKDALVGVLEQACEPDNVPYFSCRGYTSQSEVWSAAQRLEDQISAEKNVVIIHLGDHDPSGIDMSRDIEDRLRMFIAQDLFGAGPVPQYTQDDFYNDTEFVLTINRIALNFDQVQQYNPPPNPAKFTDSRARGYIQRFGTNSWELDALDPTTLVALIQVTIDSYKDETIWADSLAQEEQRKAVLATASRRWDDVTAFLDAPT